MKTQKMNEFMDEMALAFFGRKPKSGECVSCGAAVTEESFRDEKSLKEYEISYLCQDCQDTVFGVFGEGE